jgi:hypothetical protein
MFFVVEKEKTAITINRRCHRQREQQKTTKAVEK